jgi:hypothetical protein
VLDIPFINRSGEDMPPFAVFQVEGKTTVDGRTFFKAVKPSDDGKVFAFNGFVQVKDDGEGVGAQSFGSPVAYDSNDGTPGDGDKWHIVADNWKLRKEETAGTVLGSVISTGWNEDKPKTTRVMLEMGGGASIDSYRVACVGYIAATWDGGVLVPGVATVYRLTYSEADEGDVPADESHEVETDLPDGFDVPSGKCRFGRVDNGVLKVLGCLHDFAAV